MFHPWNTKSHRIQQNAILQGKEKYKGESKANKSANLMMTAATASADRRVFLNDKQIAVLFGHFLLCSLLYMSP